MFGKCKITHTLVAGAPDKWKLWQALRKDQEKINCSEHNVYIQKVLL